MMDINTTDELPDPAPNGAFWLPEDRLAGLPRRLRPRYESASVNEPWFNEFISNLRTKGFEIVKKKGFNLSKPTFDALTDDYIKVHLEATTLKNIVGKWKKQAAPPEVQTAQARKHRRDGRKASVRSPYLIRDI